MVAHLASQLSSYLVELTVATINIHDEKMVIDF